MKTIGLIGGITWYSTLDYYRSLNEEVNKRLGGAHSAMLLLNSLDFATIKNLTEKEDWDSIAIIMCDAAKALEKAGAACILIGANTMHNIAHKVSPSTNIPLIHIAEAVATEIKKTSLKKVALLGTKYTMEMDFYKDILTSHGIATIIPAANEIEFINNSIYTEFSKGIFSPATKQHYLEIIAALVKEGAEGIIFGCTEIPILVKQSDCNVPVFDTTTIHVIAAVDFALG
ncbi:aspartate/glutamate racemase family protein [soil metagenome]